MKLEPGIYPGVSFADYMKWDAVNNSLLKILAKKSPLHAKAFIERPPAPSDAFIFGKAVHCLILEPDLFENYYAVAPKCDRRTKVGKELWAAFLKNANGKEAVTYDNYAKMREIQAAIKRQAMNHYVERGEAEVCYVWIDEATGLLCKARTDYLHRELYEDGWKTNKVILIDLKSTMDASPHAFFRSLDIYDYDMQAAWYTDGWEVVDGKIPQFVFFPIEKEYPFAPAAYEIPDEIIQAGRNKYRAALNCYAECVKTNIWPGYGNTIKVLDAPDWWLKQHGVHEFNL